MRRGGGVSPVKKSGALAGRLGVRPGNEIWEDPVLDKCLLAGSAGTVGDARSKIGGGGGKISDARFVEAAAVPKFKIQIYVFSGMCWQPRGRVWTQDRS